MREVVADRLDRLTETGRELVIVAAAIGREFDFALLHRASGLDERRVAEGVEELVRRRIVQSKGEQFDLAHERVREVAWDRLLPPRRALIHRQLAGALEALYGGDLEPHYAPLAVHCSEGELWSKAVDYLTRLADTAVRRHALEEALAALQQAWNHAAKLPADERDRALVNLALRQVLCLNPLGRLTESLELLRAQHERIDGIDDPGLAGRYHFRLGQVWSFLGKSDRAVASLERAIEAAIRCGDSVVEGRAQCVLALEAVWLGRLSEGVVQARRAISLLEPAKQPGWLATAYFNLGVTWYHLGEFEEALESAGRARRLGEELGDAHLQLYAAWTAGIALGARGDWEAGIEACERALALASSPLDVAIARGFLGYVHIRKRDSGRAIPALEKAVAALARYQYPRFHGLFATLLGEAQLLAGSTATALALGMEGLDVTRSAGYAFGVGFAHRLLGRVAFTSGDLAAAARRLEEALETFTGIGARFEVARTRLELGVLAKAHGDRDAAVKYARQAHRAFTELGTPVYVERGRDLAAQLDADSEG